jgi:hypothetical protein
MDLLGGFIKRWREEGTLNPYFVRNVAEHLVGPAFDEIIRLSYVQAESDSPADSDNVE